VHFDSVGSSEHTSSSDIAQRKLGLHTVPCLVHKVDDDRMKDMREAAMQRPTAPPATSEPVTPEPPRAEPRPVGEAAQSLEFVSALLPAMNAAGSDRLRWAVLTDVAGVELARAKMATTANEVLSRPAALERASASCAMLVEDLTAAVATEARLRNVRLESTVSNAEGVISVDATLCRLALTGIAQSLMALAPRCGTTLQLAAQVTSVRPALVVESTLVHADAELTADAMRRFFDPDWAEHPCGSSGARILAAAAKVARAHGGRIEARFRTPKACVVIFVVPRPLSDV
jgi:hypothetical protein